MYLLKTDYAARISMALLDILIGEEPEAIIAATSNEAESTIAAFIGVLYNISDELAKTGADRNGYVLSLAKSVGLYFIYQRADNETIPEKVIKDYDDAMKALEKISNGTKQIDLPAKVVVTGEGTEGTTDNAGTEGTGLRRMGSATKKTHQI